MRHGSGIETSIAIGLGSARTLLEGLARSHGIPARQYTIAVAGLLLTSEGVRKMDDGSDPLSGLQDDPSKTSLFIPPMALRGGSHANTFDGTTERESNHHGKRIKGKKKKESGITPAGRKRLSMLMKRRWKMRKKAARAAK